MGARATQRSMISQRLRLHAAPSKNAESPTSNSGRAAPTTAWRQRMPHARPVFKGRAGCSSPASGRPLRSPEASGRSNPMAASRMRHPASAPCSARTPAPQPAHAGDRSSAIAQATNRSMSTRPGRALPVKRSPAGSLGCRSSRSRMRTLLAADPESLDPQHQVGKAKAGRDGGGRDRRCTWSPTRSPGASRAAHERDRADRGSRRARPGVTRSAELEGVGACLLVDPQATSASRAARGDVWC